MEKGLTIAKKGGVTTITFANPGRGNALDPDILSDLTAAFASFDPMESRCIILRGAGDKAFSSGYDLTALPLAATEEEQLKFGSQNPLKSACDALIAYPFPVIAMLNGSAYGGSVELAISCDLRIAREGIRIGMPPCRLGIIYSAEGLLKFIRLVGPAQAREIFFTAKHLEIQEAWRIGLVNQVTPPDKLEETCMEIAAQIAGNAPLSVKGHKYVFNHLEPALPLDSEEFREIARLTYEAFASDDLKEGAASFLEKRKPNFKGK